MKISSVTVTEFTYTTKMVRDSEGHSHPGKERPARQTLLTITSDTGVSGHWFGMDASLVEPILKPALIGEDPFFRERIWQRLLAWQRLHGARLNDRYFSMVDLALWDLCGKAVSLPAYKLIGGFREKFPAYGSIMVGDDFEGGLDTPEAYGAFAKKLVAKGYKAIKIHSWMPPIIPEPDPKRDIEACAAVRDAVGKDVVLLLDPYHEYSRQQALYLGRELEKLNFYWLEEPMNEHSISSYEWLSEQLDINICGPESAEGRVQTRAEWIVRHASDISRANAERIGGLTGLIKTVHLCEAHGVSIELHGNSIANLHMLAAMGIPGEYYERGLLHPFLDYEKPQPWFKKIYDPMDSEGFVSVPQEPGLGFDIDFDYIKEHTI